MRRELASLSLLPIAKENEMFRMIEESEGRERGQEQAAEH